MTAARLIFAAAALAEGPQASGPSRGVGFPARPEACTEGVVADDGSLETGYGWVPSVADGRYVQRFQGIDLASASFEKVCVCWLRTRNDDTIDFEVVFFEQIFNDETGRLEPAMEPYAAIPARAAGVPSGITGAFYDVDVSGVAVPGGDVYVGVRWDSSVDSFFFVCADQSPAANPVPVFFIDDRAENWGDALNTRDPIFNGHHAALIRAVGRAPVPGLPVSVPVAGAWALATLGGLLAFVAVVLLRR